MMGLENTLFEDLIYFKALSDFIQKNKGAEK